MKINLTPFVSQSNESVNITETNETIVKNLWQVLIDKNLLGPDYLEVKNTAAALQTMNLPLDKCHEAAFRTLNAPNPDFTKQKLLDSIDTYIDFIKQEQSDGKKDVILKDTFIPKHISPEQAYYSIYDYLLSEKEPVVIDTRSDLQKIDSHGFDRKISFRKKCRKYMILLKFCYIKL